MALAATLNRVVKHEAFPGVLLMLAAAAAMITANSGLRPFYEDVLDTPIAVTWDGVGVQKPLILWINDGLMAIFFFLIGLELKRELIEGKLKNPRDVLLPGIAAVGGMALPALVFVMINLGSPENLRGWAIPAATDIAFALGILALAGSRVPPSLKVFLLTLAILDDLGAIIIIALFYTANLQVSYLMLAVIPLVLMILINLRGSHRVAPILILGAVLWYFVLKSGVHATLAGVVTALLIPLRDRKGDSPLHRLEHGLHPYVAFLIIPVFAYANAGVVLAGMTPAALFEPLPLGIAAGLVAGKMIGVFGLSWLTVKAGLATLPKEASWGQLYGVACLAGVGFTMSLFIGSLSFADPEMMNDVRLGVLSGSIVSGVAGFTMLMISGKRAGAAAQPAAARPVMAE